MAECLMTTTVVSMEETIRQLREKAPDCLVMVGGAVLNQEYADMIGSRFLWKRCHAVRTLCTEGIQLSYAQKVFSRATLQKWTAMIYFKLGFLSKRGG